MLLVALASLPTWAVITAGSATLDNPTGAGGTTPFIAVPSAGSVVVVPAPPTQPADPTGSGAEYGNSLLLDDDGPRGGRTRGDDRHRSRPGSACVPPLKLGWRPMGTFTRPCQPDQPSLPLG